MNNDTCAICGQRLTDASGSWLITHQYLGIMEKRDASLKCCTWCHDAIMKSMIKISNQHMKEREEKH